MNTVNTQQDLIAPEVLRDAVADALGALAKSVVVAHDEVTVHVAAQNYLAAMQCLKDAPSCQFEMLLDLCGVDYSEYGNAVWEGLRYAAVSHLLSISLNQRVRVCVFAQDDDFPVLPSVMSIWRSADWYEREAFDLYGIIFDGHNDLRRILTDYGFIGHPFRKDFPLSGNVEMRYDEVQRRVIYQSVTVEPREITPRIIREDKYGGLH